MDNKCFDFIDLFCGIGGFHQAMTNLGGRCVFACEIDKYAIETYNANYNFPCDIDIRNVNVTDIPKHDVLCAGFPCQTFSKAGKQQGFEDEIRGTLFFEVVRILQYHKPRYLILENVRNLTAHNGGQTWNTIKSELHNLGYTLTEKPIIVSPHMFGIPQIRERVVILGIHNSTGINHIDIKIPRASESEFNIFDSCWLDCEDVDPKYNISAHEEMVLNCWDEFINGVKENVIGFPIWAFEFGKNYDISSLDYPKWKINFIEKNRTLYANNKEFIDNWLKKWNQLEEFSRTEQKFEWQCGNYCSSVWEGIIQFRPSGVRVKRPTYFPALVAIVQVPIIGKLKRRLTPREAARLQSFPDSFICNSNDHQAYKQFGNAVNVKVVETLTQQLFSQNSSNNI